MAPRRCGYPDATTTGVQDRTGLRLVPADLSRGRGWRWDPRGWLQVTGDGAVIENLEVSGPISVAADDVTIRNTVILATGETWGVGLQHTRNATITGNTIGTPGGSPRLLVGIKDVYGDAGTTTITGNDIAGTSTGIQIGTGIIRDNYIHDLAMVPGDHVNGVTSPGSSGPLVIAHNTILNRFDQTDAIGLFQDFGIEANRQVTDNLLAGGGYTVYAGGGGFGVSHDIRIVRNRFSQLYFKTGGSYGPVADFDAEGLGNVWADNTWDDDGSLVTP